MGNYFLDIQYIPCLHLGVGVPLLDAQSAQGPGQLDLIVAEAPHHLLPGFTDS